MNEEAHISEGRCTEIRSAHYMQDQLRSSFQRAELRRARRRLAVKVLVCFAIAIAIFEICMHGIRLWLNS